MGLNKPNMFFFSGKVKDSSSDAFKEAISLQLLRRIDPAEEIGSISRISNCLFYLRWVFLITLPKPTQDEDLKEKMKEFDRLIQIYRDGEDSQEIQEFEDSLIVHQNSQRVVNWFLTKASVFEKTGKVDWALKALNRAFEVLKEKDGN